MVSPWFIVALDLAIAASTAAVLEYVFVRLSWLPFPTRSNPFGPLRRAYSSSVPIAFATEDASHFTTVTSSLFVLLRYSFKRSTIFSFEAILFVSFPC